MRSRSSQKRTTAPKSQRTFPGECSDLAESCEQSDGDTAGADAPTKATIRQRAYELYLSRGGLQGHPEVDWLTAERQLRRECGC